MFTSLNQYPGQYVLFISQPRGLKSCLWVGILEEECSQVASLDDARLIPTTVYVQAPELMPYGAVVCQGKMKVSESAVPVAIGNQEVSTWLRQNEGYLPFLCLKIRELIGYPVSLTCKYKATG